MFLSFFVPFTFTKYSWCSPVSRILTSGIHVARSRSKISNDIWAICRAINYEAGTILGNCLILRPILIQNEIILFLRFKFPLPNSEQMQPIVTFDAVLSGRRVLEECFPQKRCNGVESSDRIKEDLDIYGSFVPNDYCEFPDIFMNNTQSHRLWLPFTYP